MNKKKKDIYLTGFGCLLFCIVMAVYTIVTLNYQNLFWGSLVSGSLSIFLGFVTGGVFLKPNSFGKKVAKIFFKLMESQEYEPQGRTISQEGSANNQLLIRGSQNQIHVNSEKVTNDNKNAEIAGNAKVFSCPKGHRYIAYQPDDNHPTATLEEEYAKKHAVGTVIPRSCKCKTRGCKSEFTLYWYKEKLYFAEIHKVPPSY